MKNKIPDRWLEYIPMGSKVAGTRFIAFKTPLSKDICSKMKPSDRFTPEILMERCPNMRLIIDLTNTDRYYNKQEFIARGIQYEKIMCPGQVIPPQSLIFRFFEIIDDFYLKNGLKDVLIGIHCTHGVNRTGYFIGRYMVQRMGFHYEKAIPCIEEARGHKIERMNYIKDLMIQVPIPSSLSSSSGKKVIESKTDFRKGNNSVMNKMPPKPSRERTPEKFFHKKPGSEYREPLNKSQHQHRRTPEPPFRPKENPPMRSGNFGPPSGRPFSPVRHGNSPVRRGISPGRRGFSPIRRPPSPGRRGGRAPSPKRLRSPPRPFSPRRRSPQPKRSPPPRRMSPPRREDFGPPSYRMDEREFPKVTVPRRSFTPPRRAEPPSVSFSSRGPPDTSARNYGSSWQPPYDNRGMSSLSTNPSSYGSSSNQFSDSRPERHSWDNRSNIQSSFSNLKSSHGNSSSHQWNSGPPGNFSAPTPSMNIPPPNFDSRSGASTQSGRFNDRRFDDQLYPPPSRDDHRRQWTDNRPNSGPPISTGRFEEGRGFSERGNDYRSRADDKFEKSYRSPPRDYPREKRPPSPPRDYSRGYDTTSGRVEPSWDSRRRSPEPSFGDFNRGGPPKRRSRSSGRRVSPTPTRRSRSPRRRSPPPRSSFDLRRSPPRSRPVEGLPSRNRSNDPPSFNPTFEGQSSRPVPEPPYQDKRFFESRDDCRDLLNQKRHFEGDRGDFYSEPKAPKLDIRVIPKEVDLRKVIRGSNAEPPLKDRLGPPPREEHSSLENRRFGRGRSRSPRTRSPPPRFAPSRRY